MQNDPVNTEGVSVSAYIDSIPEELPRDAVGLWQIVRGGRSGFHLVGPDLIEFVRRGIHALLDAGAVPVRFGADVGFDWVAVRRYGTDSTAVTEAIITEWLAQPDDPVVLYSGVWFARPRPGSMHVKLD